MYSFIFAAPLAFVLIAVAFALYAWRAYRAREYASMVARLMCVGIASWGVYQMWILAGKFMSI